MKCGHKRGQQVRMEVMDSRPCHSPVKSAFCLSGAPSTISHMLRIGCPKDGVIGGHGPVDAPHRTAWQVHSHPPSAQCVSLHMAITELSKLSKQRDIEFVLHGHLVAIVAFLRLYVSDEHTDWHAASQIAATAAGKGVGLACSI